MTYSNCKNDFMDLANNYLDGNYEKYGDEFSITGSFEHFFDKYKNKLCIISISKELQDEGKRLIDSINLDEVKNQLSNMESYNISTTQKISCEFTIFHEFIFGMLDAVKDIFKIWFDECMSEWQPPTKEDYIDCHEDY